MRRIYFNKTVPYHGMVLFWEKLKKRRVNIESDCKKSKSVSIDGLALVQS